MVVITSGLPRKPGMSRDDLIATNAGIVKSVTEQILPHSPEAIIVIVSNPLDVMTYQAWKTAGLPDHRVVGMAGVLDTARYRAFLAEALDVSPKDIQAVSWAATATQVPAPRYTTVGGIPVTEMIDADALEAIVNAPEGRRDRPAPRHVRLVRTGCRGRADGRGHRQGPEAHFPLRARLTGQYGLSDLYLACRLSSAPRAWRRSSSSSSTTTRWPAPRSAKAVKEVADVLDGMGV